MRSFLLGRDSGQAAVAERQEAVALLHRHDLQFAARATAHSSTFNDFMTMRGAMLAGGFHLVRTKGGRGISVPVRMHEQA